MPVASITGKGLAAITLAVAALWGCILGEHQMERNAQQERILVMREGQRLQRRTQPEPVHQPGQRARQPNRFVAG
jgi:hypothetical protein